MVADLAGRCLPDAAQGAFAATAWLRAGLVTAYRGERLGVLGMSAEVCAKATDAYFDTRRWVDEQRMPDAYPWQRAPEYFPRAVDQGIGSGDDPEYEVWRGEHPCPAGGALCPDRRAWLASVTVVVQGPWPVGP